MNAHRRDLVKARPARFLRQYFELDFTQAGLAAYMAEHGIHVDRSTLSNYARGHTDPPAYVVWLALKYAADFESRGVIAGVLNLIARDFGCRVVVDCDHGERFVTREAAFMRASAAVGRVAEVIGASPADRDMAPELARKAESEIDEAMQALAQLQAAVQARRVM